MAALLDLENLENLEEGLVDTISQFFVAVLQGDAATVDELLRTNAQLDPSLAGNQAVFLASSLGHTDVVARLLADARVDPSDVSGGDHVAIFPAAILGHLDVLELLLADPRVGRLSRLLALEAACKNGHPAVVNRLLADPLVNPADLYMPRVAESPIPMLQLILSDPRVDPAADDDGFTSLLSSVVWKGDAEKVRMLLAHPRIDPAVHNNAAIRTAAREGNVELLDLLLADARVDPAALNSEALCVAVADGFDAVAARLQADGRCRPAAVKEGHLCQAALRGDLAAVEELLADPEVQPNAASNRPLRDADKYSRWAVVERLLADPRVDAASCTQMLLCRAVHCQEEGRVAELLRDPRVDPSDGHDEPLKAAVSCGNLNMLRLLLADPRTLGADSRRSGLELAMLAEAARAGRVAVLSELLQDSRFWPLVRDVTAVREPEPGDSGPGVAGTGEAVAEAREAGAVEGARTAFLFKQHSLAENFNALHAQLMRPAGTPPEVEEDRDGIAAADSDSDSESESEQPLGARLCVHLLTTITAAAGEPDVVAVVPHPRARKPPAADVTAARRAFYVARLGPEAWARRRAALLGRIAALEVE